jgi:hypothetical protein
MLKTKPPPRKPRPKPGSPYQGCRGCKAVRRMVSAVFRLPRGRR